MRGQNSYWVKNGGEGGPTAQFFSRGPQRLQMTNRHNSDDRQIQPSADDRQTHPNADDRQTHPNADDPQTHPNVDDQQTHPNSDDQQTNVDDRQTHPNARAKEMERTIAYCQSPTRTDGCQSWRRVFIIVHSSSIRW